MSVNPSDTQRGATGPLVLHLPNASDDAWFAELVSLNPDMRLERDAQGALTLMPPAGYDSSRRNAEVTMQLRLWAKQDGTGEVTDSSGGFRLPNGAIRAPDAAWTSYVRLNQLSEAERRSFPPLCPEFVVELLSPTDDLAKTQAKMLEYLENGARLGWLLDPTDKTVYVYTLEGVETVRGAERISGEPLLKGFWLELMAVW